MTTTKRWFYKCNNSRDHKIKVTVASDGPDPAF